MLKLESIKAVLVPTYVQPGLQERPQHAINNDAVSIYELRQMNAVATNHEDDVP